MLKRSEISNNIYNLYYKQKGKKIKIFDANWHIFFKFKERNNSKYVVYCRKKRK